ncbi:hypothetical protein FQN50_000535 [Emmonsiellopsis sp. PD_5]|nr:hypothetical protein FQN50_000535 [Emmonsiellopsis sp. PD_5]
MDDATARSFRVLRAKTVGEFAAELAEEKGLKPHQVRLWVMVNRQNKTTRPDQLLKDPEMSIEEAFSRYGTKGNNFKLYLEVNELSLDGVSSWSDLQAGANGANGANGTSLIFLKHFDILGQSLTGIGHVHVKKQGKVSDLAPIILHYMEWDAGTQFLLYEVCNCLLFALAE